MLGTLAGAAVAVQEDNMKRADLKLKLSQTMAGVLKEWPVGDNKPLVPPLEAAEIIHEYNMSLIPALGKRLSLVVLAESHAKTPDAALGAQLKPGVEQELEADVAKHHHRHVNVVHCLSYGEAHLLPEECTKKLTKSEKQSVSSGTAIFWKVLGTMDGRLCIDDDGVDPCNDWEALNGRFQDVARSEKKREVVCARIRSKIALLESLQGKGIALLDTCPCPIYTGCNNTRKVVSEKGRTYSTPIHVLTDKEKKSIVTQCWNGYTKHLLEYAMSPGASLILLGKGLEKAIGTDVITELTDKVGGRYLGCCTHPSYNKQRHGKGLNLFREFRDKIEVASKAAFSSCPNHPNDIVAPVEGTNVQDPKGSLKDEDSGNREDGNNDNSDKDVCLAEDSTGTSDFDWFALQDSQPPENNVELDEHTKQILDYIHG